MYMNLYNVCTCYWLKRQLQADFWQDFISVVNPWVQIIWNLYRPWPTRKSPYCEHCSGWRQHWGHPYDSPAWRKFPSLYPTRSGFNLAQNGSANENCFVSLHQKRAQVMFSRTGLSHYESAAKTKSGVSGRTELQVKWCKLSNSSAEEEEERRG